MIKKIIPIAELPLNKKWYEEKNYTGYHLSLEDSLLIKQGALYEDGFIRPEFDGGINMAYAYSETKKLWERLATSTGGGLNFISSPVHEYPGYCM